MILEALLFILGFYLFAGLSIYVYAVIKSWEATGFWSFKITDTHIAGICLYPRWLLFWLVWLVNKFR